MAICSHGGHGVRQGEAFPDGRFNGRVNAQYADKTRKHWAMHPVCISAPHLIPVVSGEFELGGTWQFDLSVGDKIVETASPAASWPKNQRSSSREASSANQGNNGSP
jgi:hypothetical protein